MQNEKDDVNDTYFLVIEKTKDFVYSVLIRNSETVTELPDVTPTELFLYTSTETLRIFVFGLLFLSLRRIYLSKRRVFLVMNVREEIR